MSAELAEAAAMCRKAREQIAKSSRVGSRYHVDEWTTILRANSWCEPGAHAPAPTETSP